MTPGFCLQQMSGESGFGEVFFTDARAKATDCLVSTTCWARMPFSLSPAPGSTSPRCRCRACDPAQSPSGAARHRCSATSSSSASSACPGEKDCSSVPERSPAVGVVGRDTGHPGGSARRTRTAARGRRARAGGAHAVGAHRRHRARPVRGRQGTAAAGDRRVDHLRRRRLPAQRSRRRTVLEHVVQTFAPGTATPRGRSTRSCAPGAPGAPPTTSACAGSSSTRACSPAGRGSTGAPGAGWTCWAAS